MSDSGRPNIAERAGLREVCSPKAEFEITTAPVVTGANGMQRSTTDGKIMWHKVADGPMLKRWAIHLTKGNAVYPDVAPGEPNWMLGTSETDRQRYLESAYRHFMDWYYCQLFRVRTKEDNAASVYFNINGVEYTNETLNPELV